MDKTISLGIDTHQRTSVSGDKHVTGEKMYQFIVTIGTMTYFGQWHCDTPESIKVKQAEQQEVLRGGKIEVCYE